MSNIKILVACHKQIPKLNSDIITPIQVGTSNSKVKFEQMLYDNNGDNISAKNPYYCELTAQYWAWKNLDVDYYGFFHYRRYLNFSHQRYPVDSWENILEDKISQTMQKKYDLIDEKILKFVENYDLIITEEKNIKKMPGNNHTVYEQYKNGNSLNIKDLDIVCEIINTKYPEYREDLKKYLNGATTCLCNMYIMKKELFHEYMQWLFDILTEFELKADMSDYSIEGLRTPGHLAERLLTLFYYHVKRTRRLKIKTLQTVVVLNTDYYQQEKILPAFQNNNIAIALASNDYFVPYMSTLLQSILEHSNSSSNYDILIMTQNISERNRDVLKKQFTTADNFSIRFLDPTSFIEGYQFFVRGHFSMETYYRLVLSELLPYYDKILYLDSDMVVKDDVAKLYSECVEGYLLAACHDADTAGLYNGYEPNKKEYTDRVLKLKKPYQYFQAGTLLLNLEEFRKTYSVEEILKFAVSKEFQLLDQDILNKLCEEKVKFVDMAWNVMVDFGGIRRSKIISLAPKWLNDLYIESRKQPKIIHYAGPEKPWLYPEMDFANEFWEYARICPYYESMLYRMSVHHTHKICHENKTFMNLKLGSHGPTIGSGIQCVRDHGVFYTIKYALKKLKKFFF